MKQVKFECDCGGQVYIVGAVIHSSFATLVGRCNDCKTNCQLNVADMLMECLEQDDKEPS